MNWRQITVIGAAVLALMFFVVRQTDQTRLAGPEPSGQEPQVNVIVDEASKQTERMPLEVYVRGVVAGEMGRLPSAGGDEDEDWPEAAYAAQAILARTFIMAWLENHPNEPIASDVTKTQAYRPENITPIIERAVESTRGEVIHFQGQLAQTWFHSYAGGETATAKEGLNFQKDEPGYVASVKLPENEFAPDDVKSWSVSLPVGELQQKLAPAGINVGTIQDVSIAEFGPTERITSVRIAGSGGEATMHGAEFRLAVGPELLKSTKVDPDSFGIEGGNFVASGTGFGHGVGLSQWDAYKMARDGKSPEEIVKAFFKDIEIVQLWK